MQDFKSTEAAQAEKVTKDQLSIYALGYEQLTGDSSDASRFSTSTTREKALVIPPTRHSSPR